MSTDHTDSDPQVLAWHAVAVHPFFADCYKTEGTFLDAVLAKLDAAHAHTCKPVWRPVTFEEIQPGWEVRTRRRDGSEVTWGVAHHRGDDDWCTEAGALLTYGAMGWTYETTAPAEPNQLERGERDRRPTSAEASPPESGLTPEALAELRRDAESWLMIGGERVLPLLDALDRAADKTADRKDALPETLGGAWDRGADFVARHPGMSAEYVRAANPFNSSELARMREARDNARAEVERLTARAERVRALHYAADNDVTRTPACETCHGKAGVHECGCWASEDRQPVCGHCNEGDKGISVAWPCPTLRILDGGVES